MNFGRHVAITSATLAGACAGMKILNRLNDWFFVILVESALVIAGQLFLARIT
jgi:hypothetical protein